jgi:hypothetical protein
MLRVLATRYTSALPELRRLLLDLGLVPGEEGEGWALLDSHSGRVRLRSAERGSPQDGATVFGVEVRDPREFARRTVDDGGRAALEESPGGPRVRIAGPDGFGFTAEPTSHTGRPVDADPDMTVRLEWHTPDLDGAAAALAAIGARPRTEPLLAPGRAREFTAKNGGVLAAVRADAVSGGGLVLEYSGRHSELMPRLALAGWGAEEVAAEEAEGGSRPGGVVRLRVPTPDGCDVTILAAGPAGGAEMR